LTVQSAQGLDVSDFQGRFNWQNAQKSIPDLCFGTYRMTQGLGGPGMVSPDPDAAWNHDQIGKLGLRGGAYHFLDPLLDGTEQAQYFVAEHEKIGLASSGMLFLDHETAGSSPAATAKVAADFMAELVALRPDNPRGVYTYIDFAKEGYCAGLEPYPLWLAYPAAAAPAPPMPWARWTFWQWGTRTGVDADAFNGTSADLDAWIASFAPGPASEPQRHFATGRQSLNAFAAAQHTTPAAVLWQTAASHPGGFGPWERAYFGAGNWDGLMRPGMTIWTPPA
jgi:GH25 family lysozyme M1 (1,4-beta-N-acetylmuramidase)